MEVLKYGASGPMVELLQLGLVRSEHMMEQEIDGSFGGKTLTALQSFQNQVGLKDDGIAGAETWAALLPFLKGYQEIQVQEFDTLYTISRQNHTTVSELIELNPQLLKDGLSVGDKIKVRLPFPIVPTQIRMTSTAMQIIIEGLKVRYPFLTYAPIGWSEEKQEIVAIFFGSGKKELMVNASHHANEWITTTAILQTLESLCEAYQTDATIHGYDAQDLWCSVRTIIVPMVNPDGVDLVTGALPQQGDAYQRAILLARQYPDVPFPSGWKANGYGTDINLNYPAGWEYAKEIKEALGYTMPGPINYVGEMPADTAEAKTMIQWTQQEMPVLTISLHTQGEVIYWKYLEYMPPNAQIIAEALSQASGYPLADTPIISGFAGYKDWVIQSFLKPSFTVELGQGENPLPLSQLNPIDAALTPMICEAIVQASQL